MAFRAIGEKKSLSATDKKTVRRVMIDDQETSAVDKEPEREMGRRKREGEDQRKAEEKLRRKRRERCQS